MNPATAVNLPELLYIQNSLCGWCYGLSPVVNRVQVAFAGRLNVSVLCGGMATDAGAMPNAAAWAPLRNTWGEVEKVTGVQFGTAFKALVEDGRYGYDSAPPCRAIVAFRHLTQNPARAVAFAHAVQLALFRDGHDLNDPATYDPLAAAFGLEAAAFRRRFTAPETATAAQQEFAAVARIGVHGLPTLVLRLGEQGYVLARGYQPYEQLRQGLEQLLREVDGGTA